LLEKEKPTKTHSEQYCAYSLYIKTKETMHKEQAKGKEDKYQ